MSTAAPTPISTTLPERAFSLFCQGLRSPAISHQLGVPERTVRAWIAGIRQDIAASERDRLAEEYFRAIEHLHQLCAAAWAAFERDQDLPAPSLVSHTAQDDPSSSPAPSANARATARGRVASHGPRYLRLALDAQRQITSLLTHYDPAASNALTSTIPITPAPVSAHLSITPLAGSPHKTEIPAESATVSPLSPQGEGVGGEGPIPAESATAPARKIEIPAKTAISVASPVPLRDPNPPGGEHLVSPYAPRKEPATRHKPSAPNRRPADRKSRRARKRHS